MPLAERTVLGAERMRTKIRRFIESRMDLMRGDGLRVVGAREPDVLIP